MVIAILWRRATEKIITDKLGSYDVAHWDMSPDVIDDNARYASNRVELAYQPTRVREWGVRRFKTSTQDQQFLGVHVAGYNLFNLGRHLVNAEYYQNRRTSAFNGWNSAIA